MRGAGKVVSKNWAGSYKHRQNYFTSHVHQNITGGCMKQIPITILLLLAALFVNARASEPGKGMAGIEKMKSLVGAWEGKDKQGNPVQLTYKVVSDGNTLVETMDNGAHKESMITVYHLNGEDMMLTHYCSMGNQPRMREVGSDASSITFSFMDGTNMKTEDPHMHKLTIRWNDADHIVQEWTMQSEGKDAPPVVFELHRKG